MAKYTKVSGKIISLRVKVYINDVMVKGMKETFIKEKGKDREFYIT